VLRPTGTPVDRALFINMEGFFLIPDHAKPLEGYDADRKPAAAGEQAAAHAAAGDHDAGHHDPGHHDDGDEHEEHEHEDHDHGEHADHEEHGEAGHHHHHSEEIQDNAHHHAPLPEAQREVTAILIRAPDIQVMGLLKPINKSQIAQAVLPIAEVTNFFATLIDPLQMVLLVLTVLIVVVSGIGILISIYNSMSDRRHEIAVIRALGAGRRTVMLLVLFESILLSLGGGLIGWFLGHGLIALLGPWINGQTGVRLGFLQFVGYESAIIPGLVLLASLVGYLPALAAYRTDVAKALSSTP
jgi:putative ABC transport system permease protein